MGIKENFNLICKNCGHKKDKHFSVVEDPEKNEHKAKVGHCKNCECEEFRPIYTKEYANQVYNEFLNSFLKTRLQIFEAPKSNKKIEIENVNQNELNKRINKEKELKKCLDFLSRDKLINLLNQKGINPELIQLIHKILPKKYYKK
jgi:transcription elongation factor Elf1